ncbi:hypothetical protein ABD83_03155 [Bacillus xiamenensis]|uniref:GNAT family N-acetyltransferase n=1 Tax=Bacillus xiamenensis TaxID=1178537 RepID=A0ABT4F4I2_9BACI|nr:GNAT family N-acetyltransferase [Bacillus xiamenensis]MBG9910483.1 hypothetical protein [Bacillus xiamenensis]MCY9576972.1 GNAT family N-acetyltransferase [Bacillus xiamenensis]
MEILTLEKKLETIEKYVTSDKAKEVFRDCLLLEGHFLCTDCGSLAFAVPQFNDLLKKEEIYIFLYKASNSLKLKPFFHQMKKALQICPDMYGYVELYQTDSLGPSFLVDAEPILDYLISKSLQTHSSNEILHPYHLVDNQGHYDQQIQDCLKKAHQNGLKCMMDLVPELDMFLANVEDYYQTLTPYSSFVLLDGGKFIGHATFEKLADDHMNLIDSFIVDPAIKNGYRVLIDESLKQLKEKGIQRVSGTLSYEGKESVRKLNRLLIDGWTCDAVTFFLRGDS